MGGQHLAVQQILHKVVERRAAVVVRRAESLVGSLVGLRGCGLERRECAVVLLPHATVAELRVGLEPRQVVGHKSLVILGAGRACPYLLEKRVGKSHFHPEDIRVFQLLCFVELGCLVSILREGL